MTSMTRSEIIRSTFIQNVNGFMTAEVPYQVSVARAQEILRSRSVREVCTLVDGPVMIEVVATNGAGGASTIVMVSEMPEGVFEVRPEFEPEAFTAFDLPSHLAFQMISELICTMDYASV